MCHTSKAGERWNIGVRSWPCTTWSISGAHSRSCCEQSTGRPLNVGAWGLCVVVLCLLFLLVVAFAYSVSVLVERI